MRFAIITLTVLIAAASGSAQIISVKLISSKVERKYKKYLSKVNDRYLICGEIKSGIRLEKNSINYTRGKNKQIVLYVGDPGSPEKVPYKLKGGVKVPASKKSLLTIPTEHLQHDNPLSYFMRDQTYLGLASEYRLRTDTIDELKAARKKHKKATKAWFDVQRRVINGYERLRGWLYATGYARAAKKLDKNVASENKLLKEDAIRERAEIATASAKATSNPEELVEINQRITGGKVKFKTYESQHIRIITNPILKDAQAIKLLKLGEKIIEGFRRDFADPYRDEEIEDYTPDDIFAEFFFCPDNINYYEHFYTEFYGGGWGEDKAKRLKMSGTRGRRMRGVFYNHYSRVTDKTDFEGTVAHALGHDLTNIHFNLHGPSSPPDWMGEGAAYYCSFEYLGRNTVTCKQFERKEYDRNPGDEGIKTVQRGQRAAFNALALKKGIPVSQLLLKSLWQLDDADLAKSWSFFDFLVRRHGIKAVRWLRKCSYFSSRKENVLRNLREDSDAIFEVKDQDFYTFIEDLWKAYAKAGQGKGDKPRGRRRK